MQCRDRFRLFFLRAWRVLIVALLNALVLVMLWRASG